MCKILFGVIYYGEMGTDGYYIIHLLIASPPSNILAMAFNSNIHTTFFFF
jgi:hypothetical protein